MKTENKTVPTGNSVSDFIQAVSDEQKRRDCQTLLELMRSVTGEEPKMWGDAIVGFGLYHYVYDSGREGDSPRVGFSPRKQNITVYLLHGFGNSSDLLPRLGKYKTGKGCLYINRLSDVDQDILCQIVERTAMKYH